MSGSILTIEELNKSRALAMGIDPEKRLHYFELNGEKRVGFINWETFELIHWPDIDLDEWAKDSI